MSTSRRTRAVALLLLSIGLSWAVVFNTVLVTIHNLGARDDIGYINGGKVFRQSGTMWYHIPGLQEIGLAPQNIGGQINLRNNEFAMLERELAQVSRIDVEFALAENAMLLVILDRHREGTFWAVRLSAFQYEDTPFVNALIRWERGRVTERIPLESLGSTLAPGEHDVSVELDGPRLLVTVDGDQRQEVAFDREIRPGLALGCGENNTTIFSWHVVGRDRDGRELEWEEAFSLSGTLDRALRAIFWLSWLAWLLVVLLPCLKVALEAGVPVLDLATRTLLLPHPRWIFGVLCLFPLTPLLIQWILGGLYVVYVWITLWERLGEGEATWRVRSESGSASWRWAATGAVITLIAVGLLAAASSIRASVIGSELPAEPEGVAVRRQGMSRLGLGERVALDLQGRVREGPVRVSFRVELGEREVLRADLLQSAPPTTMDVYQVDRSQDKPERGDTRDGPGDDRGPDGDGGPGDDSGPDGQPDGEESDGEDRGPSDYELRSASIFLSSDPALPGQLRRLHGDKMELSPHGGWLLEPGGHHVVISVAAPFVTVAVDGRIVDFRADMRRNYSVGAVQLLSQSQHVAAAGDLQVEPVGEEAVEPASSATAMAAIVGLLAAGLLPLGLALLAFGAVVWLPFSRGGLLNALRRIARSHVLVGLWLVWWALERSGTVELAPERVQLVIGGVALAAAAFDLAQIMRHSERARPWWRRALGLTLLLVFWAGAFEGMARLYPERYHNWTHYWHDQLGPEYYWVHDPMIRRLNPWFIDHRFKRRDWVPDHPGKLRVVVFGGSQTYGWGIPAMDRMTFSDQLERALHARGHADLEVLNAAFPGVKTATGLRWFSGNLLRYQPDIVVVNFVVNEFMNVDQFHVWSGDRGSDEAVAPLAALALLERWRGDLMGNHLSQIIVADVYEIYEMERYLRWWKRIADEHNVRLVFSIEPTNLYVESGGGVIMRSETTLGSAQDVYRKVGAELGVPVYDVLPHFAEAQENLWFYDTMHMSRLGHRVFAENLAALIESSYLTPGR